MPFRRIRATRSAAVRCTKVAMPPMLGGGRRAAGGGLRARGQRSGSFRRPVRKRVRERSSVPVKSGNGEVRPGSAA
ncbi:hypothetical protein SLA_4410 [Streptomyces laurentii]|uniref:Uncharacterized protein n=1 Tax=Streptomyces laurentii TaxID=39478 RepID=A0A169NSZ4_STRLU|nr:hypothetical protein SLA_4410 [Streptomyces laurentii]